MDTQNKVLKSSRNAFLVARVALFGYAIFHGVKTDNFINSYLIIFSILGVVYWGSMLFYNESE